MTCWTFLPLLTLLTTKFSSPAEQSFWHSVYCTPVVPVIPFSLSDIIANHCVNHQLFADDTHLQKSAPLSEVTNLTKELNACTDDIKTWMTESQLKLNDDKTEALLFPFSSSFKPSVVSLPDSITLGSQTSPSLILPGTLDSFLTQNCP